MFDLKLDNLKILLHVCKNYYKTCTDLIFFQNKKGVINT